MSQITHLRAFAAKAYELAGALNMPLEYLDTLMDAAIDPQWPGAIPPPVAPKSAVAPERWQVSWGHASLAGPRPHSAPRQAFLSLFERVRASLQASGAPDGLLQWWDETLEQPEKLEVKIPHLEILPQFVPQHWLVLSSGEEIEGAFSEAALLEAEEFEASHG